MLKDAINSLSCKDLSATQSHGTHTTSSDIKGFILCYVPSSTAFGGLRSLMMLGGTSNLCYDHLRGYDSDAYFFSLISHPYLSTPSKLSHCSLFVY